MTYLTGHRLQWGKPDTQSLLSSALDCSQESGVAGSLDAFTAAAPYFCWETPSHLISIIQNDWPYSGGHFYWPHDQVCLTYVLALVPAEVEHTLIWTKVPIYHSDLLDETIKSRVEQDGLWGFTGNDTPPPSPSHLPESLPALSEWGITLETMIVSPKPAPDEEPLIERAGREVERFVKNRWSESIWETAWFVNPPVRFFPSGSEPWFDATTM